MVSQIPAFESCSTLLRQPTHRLRLTGSSAQQTDQPTSIGCGRKRIVESFQRVVFGRRDCDKALQSVDEEVTRAARWVEEAHFISTEGLNRGRECPVEDERTYEVRRLAEREAVLHDRVKLLVQVAHQFAFEMLLRK